MGPQLLPGMELHLEARQGAGGQWTKAVLRKGTVHWHELQMKPGEAKVRRLKRKSRVVEVPVMS